MEQCALPIQPKKLPDDAALAVSAWNMMGGEIVWEALPVVCEILGIDDPERLVRRLIVVRDHQREEADGSR